MSADDHGIFTNLRGTVCACGDAKDPGKSFCRKHYFKLPKEERNALYNSTGYVATYRRCLQLLGLQEPKAGDPPRSLNEALSRAFPSGGPRRIRKVFRK